MHIIKQFLFLIITTMLMNNIVIAANSGIDGYIRDAKTKEPLFGANIILVGTSMGGATDMDGKYIIPNVPPGTYKIRASYIGYTTKSLEVIVKTDIKTTLNFNLELVGVEGNTVIVTAQANGQKQAINQQLSSNQIINVVSADKIQELPDANAAESVGRLPGITVLRSGGEGNAVVIRGLEPKYNKILLDGIEMPSANSADRGTDLSTISSNMLDGIQVSKTVTADMDADVIGGTVNFSLREAKSSARAVPLLSALVQGSYNDLSNAYNKYNNYKFVLSGENRYLDDRLGIFAQLDMERKNLTSNELGAVYDHKGNSYSDYITLGLGLHYIPRDRTRYNGAFVMDYKLPEGKLKFSNFLSSGSTHSIDRYEFFDISDITPNSHLFQLSSSYSKLNIISNAIDIEQQLPVFQLSAKLSHTYSENSNPGDWSFNFVQTGAGLGNFNNLSNVNPENIPKAANNTIDQAITNGMVTSSYFSKERTLEAALDLKTNLNFSEDLNAEIKFGGKFRHMTRSYDYDIYDGGGWQFGDAKYINDMVISYFNLPAQEYKISLPYFTDPAFSYGKFLDGKYSMVSPMSYGKIAQLVNLVKSHTQDIANYPGGAQAYGHDNFGSTTSDYSGYENKSAFYVMSFVNAGPLVTVIPGVRYQNLETSYSGIRGIQNRLSYLDYKNYDTTVTINHGYWLPDVVIKYKPFTWCDIRASYSKTLAYPDFNAIIPRMDLNNNSGILTWNNYNLNPQRSTNYDLYLSVYNNEIGLFTIGGFLKQIDDLIYAWSFHDSLNVYLPQNSLYTTVPKGNYLINTFINNSHRVNDYGMEVDWETHFWYLPGPLSGLVFNVNYTHIFSKAEYPYTIQKTVNRKTVYVDTTFTDRLLDQPDDIVNFSIGFDYKDFSVRVSMLYQTDIFTGVNFWPQLRSHTSAYTRWDLAVKQELPWYGVQVFCNINNLNAAKDLSIIEGGNVPLSEQQYGLTADLGIRLNL